MYQSGELDREVGEDQLGVAIAFYMIDSLLYIPLDFRYVVMMYKGGKVLYLEIGLKLHIYQAISAIVGQECLSEHLQTVFEEELLRLPALLSDFLTPSQ